MQTGQFIDKTNNALPETISKRGFAELIGVSQPRVSQLIAAGLPVEPNGRIHVERGKAWMRQNLDANRRRAAIGPATAPPALAPSDALTSRAKRDLHEAEIARLKAERLAGRLIDRRATLRVVEGRAKAEREALIGWVNRVAPEIAAATSGDLAAITAILDREVRAHLLAMAEKPVELPK
jgi:hypothetical protein